MTIKPQQSIIDLMTDEEKRELVQLFAALDPWEPHPENKPQCMAFECEATEILYGGAGGGGKMLSLDTPIATPSGWTTMGDICVGNLVFDEHGNKTKVIALSEINNEPESYEVIFDDSSKILACADHLWLTYDAKELNSLTKRTDKWRAARRERRPSRVTGNKSLTFTQSISKRNSANPPTGTVRSTKQICDTLYSGRGYNHAIQVAEPIKTERVKLPLDPYVFGAWLGDGDRSGGGIYGKDDEVWNEITSRGYSMSHSKKDKLTHRILQIDPILKSMGVYKNKHIPEIYLRASIEQRMDLLCGLMDSGGTVSKKSGSVEFCNTNKQIALGIYELIVSLGWRSHIIESRAKLYGRDCGAVYSIKWTPSEYVFKLSRKRAFQKMATRRTTKFRYIVECNKIAPVPMRCIAVDSPSHLYLAGESMIPTHNTQVILGLARMKHDRSLIIRREFPELERSVISMALEFMGGKYNSAKHVLETDDKRRIEFGHMERTGNPQIQGDESKYSSAPYDFIAFDQLEEFTEYPYIFMFSRLRTAKKGQKTQIVSTANWVGQNLDWIIKRWRDWIGENPSAKSGEIRWYYRLKGEEEERHAPNGDKIWDEGAQDWTYPSSRTFIQAGLKDNPYLGVEYKAKLQQLPEPMRSALLYGDINATRTDDAYQVIPRAWVKAAMERWTPDRPGGIPTIGVDVARGGDDKTVLAARYGNWYDELDIHAGTDTPDGQSVVNFMVLYNKDALFNVDVIGVGSSVYDVAMAGNMNVFPINFGAGSEATDKSGMMRFMNKRAECYWLFRESLDPEAGDNVALPPDKQLEADLCSVMWSSASGKIRLESKEDVKKRIGHSPDLADAVVLADAGKAIVWEGTGAQKIKDYDSKWR